MFTKETYLKRRNELRSKVGGGAILLLGNDEVGMNFPDNTYSFRQDSTFLYYLGTDIPGLAAVINVDTGKTVIFGDNATIDDIVWTGPQKLLEDYASQCGVNDVMEYSELQNYLDVCKSGGQKIHFLLPYRHKHRIQLAEIFGETVPWVANSFSLPLTKAIVEQRLIKDDEEIKELDKACNITANMHRRAMEFARPGMKEQDVMAEVYRVALSEGAGISFPPIVSVRGEVLHNHHYGNILEEGQLLLVDSGGESARRYAGDMTRTFPVSTNFTSKQAEIYQVVLDAEKSAIEATGPGIPFRDVHLLAARTIVEGLKNLDIMKGDVDEAVENGAHALFFPHGLGHMIGLDVHDMENFGEKYVGYGEGVEKSEQFGLNFLRLAKKLEPGHVLTIEPGIYFIPPLIEKWRNDNKFESFINYTHLDEYFDFGGIRIEEDFAITQDGCRLLGNQVPKEISEVEKVRARS